jgi:predicted nucleic acid-binding Zn finger protein
MEQRFPIIRRRVNVQDKRDIRALDILETAAFWKEVEVSRHGSKAYEIDSSSRVGRSYHVDLENCECEDHIYRSGEGEVCSHIRAVRLFVNLIHSHIRRSAVGIERKLRQEREREEREQAKQPTRTLTEF